MLIVSPGGVWLLRRCSAVLRLRWRHLDSTGCAMPGLPHGPVLFVTVSSDRYAPAWPPAPKARSGRVATWARGWAVQVRPLWCCPWLSARDRSGLLW